MNVRLLLCCCAVSLTTHVVLPIRHLAGDDWVRFRGPNGKGIAAAAADPPTHWSRTKNLKWQIELPGPGSSSPIVFGDRLFVTCWKGYGIDRGDPGDQQNLKRVLLCVDRNTGETRWSRDVDPYLPEDAYGGMFAEHGYATHTPVTDGERIYCFFGKSGVHAFTLDGEPLWSTPVGTESGSRGWGTSSSPILYDNLVIVPATAESEAVVALDKQTGREVWRQEAAGFSGTWGTPILVDVDDRQELVVAVPYEIWAIDPATGKLRWYCDGLPSDSVCTSVVADGDRVYAVGGRNGGALAVRAGGKGDVTGTHVLWRKNERARIGTPIYYRDRLYWISNGVANCVDATSGEKIYQERLSRSTTASSAEGATTGSSSRRRRGGGQDYSSAVVAGDRLYYVTRAGETFVIKTGDTFAQLATNRIEDAAGDFSATPAISGDLLFIRSSKNLYCIAAESKPE